MEQVSASEEPDRTPVSLLCALTITVLAVVFYVVVGINEITLRV